MAKTTNHFGRRYAVIIGPGPHWFHELQSSWFEQRSQIHTNSEQNTVPACAFLFTLFSAQFLVHFLSNGGDRGLRVRVISDYCCGSTALMFCLLVASWLPLCDESTAWWVDPVTSWPVTSWPWDESTGWRVDHVTSWLAALTYSIIIDFLNYKWE